MIDTKLSEWIRGPGASNYTFINPSKKLSSKKYIINNQAPLITSLKNLYFCPFTSVIDQMGSCSYNSAKNIRGYEYGNMNISLKDSKGNTIQIIVKNDDNKNEVEVTVIYTYLTQPNIVLNTIIDINSGKQLAANFVYKNLLNEIILKIQTGGAKALNIRFS